MFHLHIHSNRNPSLFQRHTLPDTQSRHQLMQDRGPLSVLSHTRHHYSVFFIMDSDSYRPVTVSDMMCSECGPKPFVEKKKRAKNNDTTTVSFKSTLGLFMHFSPSTADAQKSFRLGLAVPRPSNDACVCIVNMHDTHTYTHTPLPPPLSTSLCPFQGKMGAFL